MNELKEWLPLILALFASGGTWGMFRSTVSRLEKDVEELRETALNQIRLEEQIKTVHKTQEEHSTILREVRDAVLMLKAGKEQ